SEEHTSELQSRLVISYAVFCLKKKKQSHFSDSLFILSTYKPTVGIGLCTFLSVTAVIKTPTSYTSFFFFNDTATTKIYTTRHTLSLHDALPIFTTLSRCLPALVAACRMRFTNTM